MRVRIGYVYSDGSEGIATVLVDADPAKMDTREVYDIAVKAVRAEVKTTKSFQRLTQYPVNLPYILH